MFSEVKIALRQDKKLSLPLLYVREAVGFGGIGICGSWVLREFPKIVFSDSEIKIVGEGCAILGT
ncbi:MAG: hypothetical protein IJ748_00615 [Bacteroidales bacterium]|nr:hypothetical protein [Bacteroidales bacterium]